MLFKNVKCKGYLRKVYDGKFMEIHNGSEVEFLNSNEENFSMMSDCCGDHEFLKEYYEPRMKEFSGFVVGYKEVVMTGWLCADIVYDCTGRENLKVYKEPEEVTKCAIVYFANNRKRYVPVEYIEVEQ